MTGFLGEIGKKLADRWVALLAIPGLLYLGAVIVAAVLGQAHGLSYPDLSRKIAAWAASPTLKSAGGTVLIIAAVLAGSVLIGLTAAAGGRFIEMLWTLPGKRVPAEWLASWRRGRSRKAKAIADDPDSTSAQVRKAIARADRICLIEADRPTWIGDRLRACHVRIERAYGLDLNAAWPRLWLTVPDTFRTELGAARDAFSGAALLTAWAVLYLALGIWWWPAIPIALITGATAIIRAHLATNNLADLIESAADLQGRDLATQLDENLTGPMTPAIGKLVTTRMRKSRWDPSSPLEDLNSRQAEAASRIHPEDATKPVPATAPADLSLSLLQRSSRQAMSAVGHHLSTGRDQASGTRFRVRFWPRTTVAGQMIVAGFAVIVGAASGTATALAGLGTAIAGEVAAGVLVAGVVAGVATLQLSATDAAPRRSEVRTRKSDSPSGEAWETAVSKDLADDGDDGSSNGNDNGDEAGGERQAWPGLSCPDTVVAGTAFDLYVGLAGDRDTSVYGTGRLQVPAEEFELGIEIQANGFAMLRGVRKFTLHVTPEDPFPIRSLRLEPTEDPGFRERRIEALFTVGGELRGYAARDVTVVATRDEAAAAGERSHDHSADVPARQPNVLGGGREVADMTIMIIKDAKQPTTLNWSASSPYFDILLSTSEPPHSDMGDPAAFLGEVVRKASEAFSVEHGFQTLRGIGLTIAGQIPAEIQDAIRQVAGCCQPAAPTILLATQDPYIPWELAVLEPPIGTAGGRSPFLGAQAAIGRWPLPKQPPPPRNPPRSVAVNDRAVITGSYVGVIGAAQLPDAEDEAKRLLDAWPGAKRIPASFREVMDCLGGDPPADVLHFALHGKFDESGRQEGVFLIGKQPGEAGQERVEILSPFDVRGSPLGRRAPLVFLNACQVGASREVLGDYAGMAEAFLQAGASGVIAPLWSIDDGAAKTLALSFYKSASGADAKPPAEILREERARLDRNSVREDPLPPLVCLSYQFFGHPRFRVLHAVHREA